MSGSAKPGPDGGAAPAGAGFEDAMTRLEAIVAEMESGDLPLDALVKRFEEGRALADKCAKELDAVKKRIDKVLADGSAAPLEV